MNTALDWALAYVAAGLLLLGSARAITWYRNRGADALLNAYLSDVQEPPTRKEKFIAHLKLVGMWLFMLSIWPVVAPILVHSLVSLGYTKPARAEPDPQDMFYAKGHLTERVSIEEAERREHYSDPLGRVPTLPFGHLNTGWKAFLAAEPANGELWAFHRKTDNKKNWSFDRANGTGRGYCWVVADKVIREIRVES